ARDVDGVEAAGERREALQEQRRLADAGVAAEQRHLPRDETAAERAVEFGDAARGARNFPDLDVLQRHGPRSAARAAATLARGFAERPGGAARRAAAEPLQGDGAAFGADVGGLGFHGTSATGTRGASAHSSS